MKRKLAYTTIGILIFILSTLFLLFAVSSGKYRGPNIYSNKCGIQLPKPKGYTSDFVTLYLPNQINILDSIMGDHEKRTGNQVALISIDSSMLGKCTVEEYALEIGKQWGVGQKDKNNGIVICIAPSLRKISIQNGYGIEKILSNNETKIIIDSIIIPEFKKSDYFEGTRKGLLAIINKLRSRQN